MAQAAGRHDGQGIARNTAFQLAAQVASGAFSAALILFLTRSLSPTSYGVFALALGIGGLLMLPADLGISASAARFVAERRGDPVAVGDVTSQALGPKLASSALASAALFAAAGPIASAFGGDELVWPLRGIALAIFGQSAFLFLGGLFLAQGRADINLRLVAGESSVEVGTTVALVLLGAGGAGAALGRAVGYGVGAVVGIVLTARLLGRRSIVLRSGEWTPQVLRYAGPLALTNWVTTFLAYIDTVIVGALLTTTAVGLVQAPMRIVLLLHYPATALGYVVAPRVARHAHERPNVAAFVGALRLLVIIYAALVPPLVVWPDPIVQLLFGRDYSESAGVLRALAPFVFLAGLSPLLAFGANYLGAARGRLPIALAALVILVAVDLALVPTVGIVGAPIGLSLAYVVYVPAHLWLCQRHLRFALRPILATVARSALAAVAFAAVLLAVGAGDLSLAGWLVGLAAGTAAFGAVLLVLGETSPRELRAARRTLRRWASRRTL